MFADIRVRGRDAAGAAASAAGAAEIPPVIATSAGNVLVHFLGSLKMGSEAVVRTQLDLDASSEAIRELVGSIDLSRVDGAGSPVEMEVGYSQTLLGKIVKLKEPLALIRPEELKAGRIAAEIVHYEIYFGTQPIPRVAKRPLDA